LVGDQGGGVLVSVLDDFHEVAGLLGVETLGSMTPVALTANQSISSSSFSDCRISWRKS